MTISTTPCPVCNETGFWSDYYGARGRRMKETGECFSCAFWAITLEKQPQVVIQSGVYSIGREPPVDDKGHVHDSHRRDLGMSGRRFDIEFFDGRKVTTHNLWHGGVIPERFRHLAPDNARFAGGAERVQVGETTCFNPSVGS